MKIELNMTVYHKDVYDGQEPLVVVGIRADEIELEGDYSGGTHGTIGKCWLRRNGVLLSKPENKDVEETSIDISKINGIEILEFIKDQLENNDDWCDVSFYSPEFENQEIDDKSKYKLKFGAYYNNWGEDQLISGNRILITRDSVTVRLEEPFDYDGSDEIVEQALLSWLKTHKFKSDNELKLKFYETISYCVERLKQTTFEDKKVLDDVIRDLSEARVLMK